MNTKNLKNLIFGTARVYLIFLFCVGLTHAQRVDVVDHLGNKAQTGTVVTESTTGPTSPKQGDIWIDTSKTPNTTNIWDGTDWTEVKPSYQSVLQDTDADTKIQLEEATDDDTIRFDTGGEERMVITDEGNVGIGTSSPSEELHLSKSASGADVSVRIQNSAVTSGDTATLRFSVTSNSAFDSAFVGSDRSNSLILGSNTSERMRIDSSGRVNIGGYTNSQGYELEVVNDTDANTLLLHREEVSVGGVVSTLGFQGTQANDQSARFAEISSEFDVDWGGDLVFSTKPPNGTPNNTVSERMRIDSLGNVGIGQSTIIGSASSRATLTMGGSLSSLITFGNNGTRWGGIYASFGDYSIFSDSLMRFEAGGSERMRIDSSGNLLIGGKAGLTDTGVGHAFGGGSNAGLSYHTADGAIAMSLNRLTSDGNILRFVKDGTAVGHIGTFAGDLTIGDDDIGIRFDTGSGLVPWDLGANSTGGSSRDAAIDIGVASARFKDLYLSSKTLYQASGGNQHSIGADANDLIIRSETAGSETARFTYGGNLLVGKTSTAVGSNGQVIKPNGETFHTIASGNTLHVYSSAASVYRFYVSNGGQIFATSTSISGISDERVKENIRDLDDGLSKVMELKPRKFDWKEGKGKNITNDRGFIAQEFEQVFPDLVSEWKDEAPEGEEPYKSVSADLIPTLVKAIQELKLELDETKKRITQLENN